MIALPADDFTLSPFTGWTRAHWTRVADTVLDGAKARVQEIMARERLGPLPTKGSA